MTNPIATPQTQPETVLNLDLNEPQTMLANCFDTAIDAFHKTPGLQRLWRGELNRNHYAALMREIYFHARENPQLQALATVYFRNHQRDMVRPFLRHALSEVGHDQLARSDAEAVGMDPLSIDVAEPLIATQALTAFPFYQIQFRNPVGYLGYLYFLEHMPMSFGSDYMSAFDKMGITADQMSFLADHTTIDVGHTKAMQSYVSNLITNAEELGAATSALRTTSVLYSNMVTAAFNSVDSAIADNTNQVPGQRVG